MTFPSGKTAIFAFYEWDPKVYLSTDGRPKPSWERDMMRQFTLPAPMKLSWALRTSVSRITLHKKAGAAIIGWLEEVHKGGLWSEVEIYGGGYEFRVQRGSTNLSMHALGAAVDIDPKRNPLGAIPEGTNLGGTPNGLAVVSMMERRGITWGGRFKPRRDCQHGQCGSAY